MFRQKIGILLLICLFLLFIEQGIAAETDSNQRDGAFVIAGQMTGGFLGHLTGGVIGVVCAWSIFNFIRPGPGWGISRGSLWFNAGRNFWGRWKCLCNRGDIW